MRFTKLILTLAILLATCSVKAYAEDPPAPPLVKIGAKAPLFTGLSSNKKEISLSQYKGKVLVLTFFATWCPECQAELPHLQNEVWQKFKPQGLVVLAVGREHSVTELAKFKANQKLSITFVADPKREIYEKYAKSTIPRNFVIAKDGTIAFESQGYSKEKFSEMIKVIKSSLK